jgi:hypothetical protein
MSLAHLTYIKTLFQAILFAILVPFVLFEVFKSPRTAGRKVLEQGATLP